MKNLKKIMSALLATVLVLCLVTGCAQEAASDSSAASTSDAASTSEPVSSDAADDGEEHHVRFAWWGGDQRHEAWMATFEMYRQNHNENFYIDGEPQSVDGYLEKLITQLASGTEPDLMSIDGPWVPELGNSGDYFVDFNETDIDFSNFDQALVYDHGTVNGKLIAIPQGAQCEDVVVNRARWEALGLEDKEYKWSELIEEAKRIRADNPEVYLLGSDEEYVWRVAKSYLKALTGEQIINDDFTIGFTEDDLLSAFTMMKDAFEAGVFQPMNEGNLYYQRFGENPEYAAGNILGWFAWNGQSNYGMSSIIEQPTDGGLALDALPVPVPDTSKGGASNVRPLFCLSISNRSAYVDECIEFTDWWMNSTEAADGFTSNRGVPASSVQKDHLNELGLLEPVTVEGLEDGMSNAAEKENANTTITEITMLMEEITTKVCAFELTPEEGVATAFEQLTAKLEELKAKA